MAAMSVVRQLFQESDAKGTRSSGLRPLQWILGTLITGLLGSVWLKAPEWVTASLTVGVGVFLLLGVYAYIYFMIKNPDFLRSEAFTLHKMAIEKGLIGDNVSGLIEPEDSPLERIGPLENPSGGAS